MAPSVPLEYTEQRDLKPFSQSRVMGKARKFSKVHSAGFVPDYRHAIETTADSEVFGSSGRVETGMAVSADLYAPKRKSISLNGDTYERYGVPLETFSLSKMSRHQRRQLELRFKNELEQVRRIQKEIESFNSNAMVSSYIRTCSDEPKHQPVDSFQRSMDMSQGKKRAPPGRNGPRTKGSSAGRMDLVKQAPPSTSNANAMLMKRCETLLNGMMSHQYGWVFNTPVDVVKLNIPDYFNVIKHPMDLGTVKNKLQLGEYSSPLEFAADVRLTFSNAMTYNPRGNDVHIMADALSKYFEARWKPIEKKVPVVIDTPVLSTSSVHIETETPRQMSPKKKKFRPVDNKIKQDPPVKRVMTDSDKHKLSVELAEHLSDESLSSELPYSIIDLLKKQSNNSNDAEEGEIEIDIDALDNDTLFTLRKLLDDHVLDRQKKQVEDEAREMKLLHNSGPNNLSTQPHEGNDPLDEDVDIGGNDPPLSSCPPVEIEKDMTLRNSKCSSSSSSSSDSGSSSSDSDSGSSGSDSDGGRAPAASRKEKLGSGENVGQKRNDRDNTALGEDLVGVNQIEQNSQSNALGVDVEVCQEGESAPTGRQVSPDKLYRAALLRSRFADTILKAQEKTLDKGEKTDPEKLRLEREELERRRKEEKARLQAEAKAAEEARRKAEADAIAEAKRRRELEREKARQALQNMEKTVEINENCQFMEDLEMLRAAPVEHVESYADVASPVLSETGLGSFKFQGNSNPLEQLGLYMKMDDEEEDEAPPPQSGLDAANGGDDDEDVDIDVEEGEID